MLPKLRVKKLDTNKKELFRFKSEKCGVCCRKSKLASKFKAKFVFKLSGPTYKCMNFLEMGKKEFSSSEASDSELKSFTPVSSTIIPVGDCCYEKAKAYHNLNHFMYHTYVKLKNEFERRPEGTGKLADFLSYARSENVVQKYREELLIHIKPFRK